MVPHIQSCSLKTVDSSNVAVVQVVAHMVVLELCCMNNQSLVLLISNPAFIQKLLRNLLHISTTFYSNSLQCLSFADQLECPGHYRCSGSTQCIPIEQLCDGIRQCPLADDEKFCDSKCPNNCTCEGLTVDCSYNDLIVIPGDIDRHVRFLDLSGNILSMLQPYELKFPFLVKLFLMQNNINSIATQSFLALNNLQTLDLSYNQLHRLSTRLFDGLVSLVSLNLTGNPLINLEPLAFHDLHLLPLLDLSDMTINKIHDYTFLGLHSVEVLILTNNDIKELTGESFNGLSNVTFLELTSNPLNKVKRQSFSPLISLNEIHSDHYKICCMATQVSRDKCTPPEDPISSCLDLMANDILRTFIWILGSSACLGNVLVVILRCRKPTNNVPDFIISNLAVSDFMVNGTFLSTQSLVFLQNKLFCLPVKQIFLLFQPILQNCSASYQFLLMHHNFWISKR